MSPLFAEDQLFRDVLLAGYVVWAAIEVSLLIFQIFRLRMGAQLQDRGSRLVISITLGAGILLCWFLARTFPAAAIAGGSVLVFWMGIVLVCVGLAFRLYAISVLGHYFTPSVTVAEGQKIVEHGPYRLIRHPSYTGLLIMLLGFGLSSANWLSLFTLMGCTSLGLSYRIYVEERVLQEHLGTRYREYMRRTKRLIPFVF